MFCRDVFKCRISLLVICLGLIVVGLVAGCGGRTAVEPEGSVRPETSTPKETTEAVSPPAVPDDVLHIAVRAERLTLQAEEIAGGDLASASIARQMYRGLASVGADGKAEKDLAEEWYYEEDGRVWNVIISEGARLHDETEVSAGYIARLWDGHLNAAIDSPPAVALANVTEIIAVDRRHLRFRLNRRDLGFPTSVLTAPALLVAGDGGGDRPVGSGSYRFHAHTAGGAVVLRAVKDDDVRFSSLVFHLLCPEVDLTEPDTWDEDTAEIINRARMVMFVRPDEASRAKSALQMRLISAPGFNIRGLVLNDRRRPLDIPGVREAVFAAAGDGEHLLDEMAESAPEEGVSHLVPAYTWLPASHPGQGHPGLRLSRAPDSRQAEQLMHDAQLNRGSHGQWQYRVGEAFAPFAPTLLVPEDAYAAGAAAAEVVAERLQDAGVKVQVERVAWRQFLSRYFSRQYDLAFVGWCSWASCTENFAIPWLHSEGVNTMNQLDRLRVDRLLEESAAENLFEWLQTENLLLPLYTAEVVFAVCPQLELGDDFLPVPHFRRLR